MTPAWTETALAALPYVVAGCAPVVVVMLARALPAGARWHRIRREWPRKERAQ